MQLIKIYRKLFMQAAHLPVIGKLATRLATIGVSPHYGLWPLASLSRWGYRSPSARISHEACTIGRNCFLGEQTLIYGDSTSGGIHLGEAVHIHQRTTLQSGDSGSIVIGDGTHIQPDCLLSGFRGDIIIGENVEIAARCAFYSYNHQFDADQPIRDQPINSAGGIEVANGAWLGTGVILLDGSVIGAGAVVAAGSVVNSVVPDNSIAAGNPARVIGIRT